MPSAGWPPPPASPPSDARSRETWHARGTLPRRSRCLASLALVAMTVGLMRAETAADRAVLVALGSSRRQQRDLAAATAGTLAVAAVATGTAIAYLSLLAQNGDHLARLLPVPACHLATLCLGLPLVAVVGSWALARDR